MNRTFEPEALSHGEHFKSPATPISNRLARDRSCSSMNKVLAIAGVVIKELCRRKDFLCSLRDDSGHHVAHGLGEVFGDDKIVRYLKDICLLLIWVSALVIAIATQPRVKSRPSARIGRSFRCWPSR